MPIPTVRNNERTRTKKGHWRRKRNDEGIQRIKRKEINNNGDIIDKNFIGIDWYTVYEWLINNPNANNVEFVEYMEKIQNELIVIDNPNNIQVIK